MGRWCLIFAGKETSHHLGRYRAFGTDPYNVEPIFRALATLKDPSGLHMTRTSRDSPALHQQGKLLTIDMEGIIGISYLIGLANLVAQGGMEVGMSSDNPVK